MSAPAPAPLDILRVRLAPLNTSPQLPHPNPYPSNSSRQSPYSPPRSGLTDPTLALPTPPPETALPARDATVYLPTPLHPHAVKYARERFGRVIMPQEMELGQAMVLADGIVNRQNTLPKPTLDLAPKLVGIGVVGGTDTIDLAECKDRRICVMNCPGSNAPSVAELTLALTLALLRRVPELDARIRRGDKCLAIDHLGRTLFGKEVGVVGMGSTARKAAELFHHAFGCTIHVFSPTSPSTRWTSHDPLGALPHTRHSTLAALPHTRHSTLASMLPLLDVLSLHCPLTPSTRGLISEAELGSMKPGSVLINMSRGAVVDEMALAQALREQKSVMGAASDVFEVEPVRREMAQGLFELENFIGTPHIGGSTVEAQIDVAVQAIDQLADLFDGYPVRNRVC